MRQAHDRARMNAVPESAERSAQRKRRARAAERRRQAITALQIGECACRYAAAQLGNGASPEDARLTALEMAGELVAVAEALRKAVRLDPAQRRALARLLAGQGMTQKQVAARLGVSERTVRNYALGCRGHRHVRSGA